MYLYIPGIFLVYFPSHGIVPLRPVIPGSLLNLMPTETRDLLFTFIHAQKHVESGRKRKVIRDNHKKDNPVDSVDGGERPISVFEHRRVTGN